MYSYLQPRNGPVVDGLESEETVYAADQPEYTPLRTLRADGKMGGVVSRWTPTEEQRKAIGDGADIFLELSTFYQPLQPIRMAVSDTSGEHFGEWFKVAVLNKRLCSECRQSPCQCPDYVQP